MRRRLCVGRRRRAGLRVGTARSDLGPLDEGRRNQSVDITDSGREGAGPGGRIDRGLCFAGRRGLDQGGSLGRIRHDEGLGLVPAGTPRHGDGLARIRCLDQGVALLVALRPGGWWNGVGSRSAAVPTEGLTFGDGLTTLGAEHPLPLLPVLSTDEVLQGDANMGAMTDEVHKKLGIRPGIAGAVVATGDEAGLLSPLPDGFKAFTSVSDLASTDGAFDYVHFFARNRAELVKEFPRLREKLAPGGSLWISWIKQSAIRGGGGLPGDLNENAVRRMALSSGLVDVKVASLDAEWSALKLVWRRH